MKAIVMDDEYYAARYLEMICKDMPELSIEGVFENAIAALEFLKKNEIQLVLSDIEMPGLSGMEAVREIRRIRPDTGVIFVTSHEQYAFEAFRIDAVAYIMKPCSKEDLEKAVAKAMKLLPESKKRIEICTFGSFCVMIDGRPLRFANSKAEELLALLVDRQGAVMTMEQITAVLWEDRPYDEMVKRLYRKAVGYLNQLFREKGINLFVAERGCCHIDPQEVDCDYYRLFKGDKSAIARYDGVYMSQFSWAESTTGRITQFLAIHNYIRVDDFSV